MRLTVTTFVTMDGVMQSPGGPEEDPRDGFDLGGWLPPHFGEETGQYMNEVFEAADAAMVRPSPARGAAPAYRPGVAAAAGPVYGPECGPCLRRGVRPLRPARSAGPCVRPERPCVRPGGDWAARRAAAAVMPR